MQIGEELLQHRAPIDYSLSVDREIVAAPRKVRILGTPFPFHGGLTFVPIVVANPGKSGHRIKKPTHACRQRRVDPTTQCHREYFTLALRECSQERCLGLCKKPVSEPGVEQAQRCATWFAHGSVAARNRKGTRMR